MEQINLKYLLKLLLKNKKALIWGQVVTIFAICISVPIPLMLPALVDEVLLNKPGFFLNTINNSIGMGNAFYYILIVTIAVIFLRFIHFVLNVITTKIFTKISKYITFEIRKKAILHLEKVCMNEYESLGSGSIAANLVTDVNTLDDFIIKGASKFVASVLTLIAVSIVMIAIHPLLGLMILLIQPIIMLISKKISKKVGTLKKKRIKQLKSFKMILEKHLNFLDK